MPLAMALALPDRLLSKRWLSDSLGLCPYNGVNSKIVLYLFLGGTALSGIKKSNLNLTMSKSMLGCASQAGTSGESATCHLAAA